MSKLLVVVLFLIVLIGAADLGRPESRPGSRPWIDPRLESAVTSWSEEVGSVGLDPETLLSRLDSITVGPCRKGKLGHVAGRLVRIDPKVLARGDASTDGAVYHELGHAVLGLDHCGEGIMRETAHRESEYQYHWPAWVKEYLNLSRDAKGI